MLKNTSFCHRQNYPDSVVPSKKLPEVEPLLSLNKTIEQLVGKTFFTNMSRIRNHIYIYENWAVEL